MIHAAIRKALEVRLAAIVPAWKIVFEATTYNPNLPVPFMESDVIFGNPQSNGIFGAAIMHVGVLQVMVVTENRGGPNAADEQISRIAAQFKRGTHLTVDGLTQQLWVPDEPVPGRPTFLATWRRVPVTITWNALAPG